MSVQTIEKNVAWLMLTTIVNKVIAFVTFTLVARLAGVNIIGSYFFSVAVTSVFVILMDLGMTPVVIRAISASREDGPRLLSAALYTKLFLIPLAIVAALSYGWWREVEIETFAAIAVACAVMSADALHLLLYGALRGRQNLRFEAVGMLVGQILTATIAISIALISPTPAGLAAALLVGSIWNVVWASMKLRALHITLNRPGRTEVTRLLREAIPFGIAGIAVKIYSYADSLLIEKFHGLTAVGLYAVAYKLTYALQFLPLTFTAALYPALAKHWAEHDHDKLLKTFLGSMRFLAAIGFPITAGLSALAPQLILLIYGPRYAGSVAPFVVLPWVLLPIFLDFPIGALLNATHRAALKTTAMVGTMFVNVVLNLLLVPWYGLVGAAWAAVVSFWTLLFIGLFFTRRDTHGLWPTASLLIRSIGATIIAWFVWRMSAELVSFFSAAVFGALISILLAFSLRLVTQEDVLRIIKLGLESPKTNTHVNG